MRVCESQNGPVWGSGQEKTLPVLPQYFSESPQVFRIEKGRTVLS